LIATNTERTKLGGRIQYKTGGNVRDKQLDNSYILDTFSKRKEKCQSVQIGKF
jgi:hypothetical protein